MIIVLCMLGFSFTHKIKSVGKKAIYFLSLLPLSYMFSVTVNAFRIIVSVMVNRLGFLNRLMSEEVAHNLTGMLIFFSFLLLINYGFSSFFKKTGGTYEKTA